MTIKGHRETLEEVSSEGRAWAAGVCNGEFLTVAGVISENTIADVLQKLPRDSTAEPRQQSWPSEDAKASRAVATVV